MAGLFARLKEGLAKTRENLMDKITELVTGHGEVDDDFFDQLEEILLQADIGVSTAVMLTDRVRRRARSEKIREALAVRKMLKEEITSILVGNQAPIVWADHGLTVMLIVGVNGAGKTTTLGKLAARFKGEGKRVMLAAGDTFRAAAIEQLETWGRRAGVPVIKHKEGADPAAVAYDAVQSALARGMDVLLIDTAGRLQTKVNLMEEIKKVHRVIQRELATAPHEVLLVLDATTGQNAISQAKLFTQAVGVTGIVLTKLDGTAKGGVIIGIKQELGLPVKLVGVGERIEDLRDFDATEFADVLFSD